MKRALLIFAILSAGVMLAFPQTAPVLSDAQKAAFFKAQSRLASDANIENGAAQKLAQSRAEFDKVIKGLQDFCGADFQAQMNHDGDPVCVAKPAAKPDVKTEPKK